ncbi:MAG: hypothetical protein Q9166_006341 [cf. Caloplaca sp. 2 TL-2023]
MLLHNLLWGVSLGLWYFLLNNRPSYAASIRGTTNRDLSSSNKAQFTARATKATDLSPDLKDNIGHGIPLDFQVKITFSKIPLKLLTPDQFYWTIIGALSNLHGSPVPINFQWDDVVPKFPEWGPHFPSLVVYIHPSPQSKMTSHHAIWALSIMADQVYRGYKYFEVTATMFWKGEFLGELLVTNRVAPTLQKNPPATLDPDGIAPPRASNGLLVETRYGESALQNLTANSMHEWRWRFTQRDPLRINNQHFLASVLQFLAIIAQVNMHPCDKKGVVVQAYGFWWTLENRVDYSKPPWKCYLEAWDLVAYPKAIVYDMWLRKSIALFRGEWRDGNLVGGTLAFQKA